MTEHSCILRKLRGIALMAAIGIGCCLHTGSVRAQEKAEPVDQLREPLPVEELEWDPWEGFNEKMFNFNRRVDRFVLKPVATAYNWVLPTAVQRGIHNAIDNSDVVRRLTNNILQLKVGGTIREVSRFTINTTFGIAGLFDVSHHVLGIEQIDEDTGQTLGYWGVGPGPYLILPFLPPTTVRDGFGSLADAALNPLNYLKSAHNLRLVGRRETVFRGTTAGIATLDIINERSLNLEKFASVEETVLDLYGAVRNAYLQSRAAAIKQ